MPICTPLYSTYNGLFAFLSPPPCALASGAQKRVAAMKVTRASRKERVIPRIEVGDMIASSFLKSTIPLESRSILDLVRVKIQYPIYRSGEQFFSESSRSRPPQA